MSNNKRVILYIASSYFFISLLLFCVYIVSYRYYFYRVNKKTVLEKSKAKEEIFLRTVQSKYKVLKQGLSAKEHQYVSMLEKAAAEKLQLTKSALLALSNHGSGSVVDEVQEENKETDERLKEILVPYKKKDFEKPFISLFDKLANDESSLIKLRRSGNGVPIVQVPLNYKLFGKEEVQLKNGEHSFKWTIYTYGVPFEQMGYREETPLDLLKEIKLSRYPDALDRLAVFAYGKEKPVYRGKKNQIKALELKNYEKDAKTSDDYIYNPDYENKKYENGSEVAHVNLVTILTDPELQLSFTLVKAINEQAWMSISFFSRNKVPILAFAFLAWIVCPFLAVIAYRMALKFRFSLTLDLDDEEEETLLTKPYEDEEDEASTTAPQEITSNGEAPQNGQPALVTNGNGNHTLHKEAEKMSSASPFAQINPSELINLRENNIRKSQGTFNSHQDDDKQNVDYLEGVQSDVLKSLIKKLREQ